jgi:Protease inhibitor Inh
VTARALACGVLLFGLTACAGGGLSGITADDASKTTIAGRWMLAAPNAPPCGMDFAEREYGRGIVRPDGGCPASFFKSRKWLFERNALTVLDDNDAVLGQLTLEGGQFQGKAMNGTPLSLTRPVVPTTQ